MRRPAGPTVTWRDGSCDLSQRLLSMIVPSIPADGGQAAVIAKGRETPTKPEAGLTRAC